MADDHMSARGSSPLSRGSDSQPIRHPENVRTPKGRRPLHPVSDFGRRFDNLPAEDGWDTYGGKATTDEAKRTAGNMVPVPMSDGGIQLEMHAGGCDLEIEIDPEGRVSIVTWESHAA